MPIQDPLTQQIIGLCYRIANTLGHGFAEKVYENALAFEFRRAKVSSSRSRCSTRGRKLGTTRPTSSSKALLQQIEQCSICCKSIVEVKAIQALSEVDVAQGLKYLRATGLPTCLLINFGKAKIEVRRLGMSPGRGTGDIEIEVKDIQ